MRTLNEKTTVTFGVLSVALAGVAYVVSTANRTMAHSNAIERHDKEIKDTRELLIETHEDVKWIKEHIERKSK